MSPRASSSASSCVISSTDFEARRARSSTLWDPSASSKIVRWLRERLWLDTTDIRSRTSGERRGRRPSGPVLGLPPGWLIPHVPLEEPGWLVLHAPPLPSLPDCGSGPGGAPLGTPPPPSPGPPPTVPPAPPPPAAPPPGV